MKQPTKRFLSIIVSVGLVVGALVMYLNFTRPLYEEANKIRGQVYANREFVDRQKAIVAEVGNLIKKLNEPDDKKIQNTVSLALPTDPDLAGILAQVYGISSRNGIRLKSARFAPVAAPSQTSARLKSSTSTSGVSKPLGTVLISMRLEGDYTNIKLFVDMMAKNLRIFEPRKLNIRPSQDKKTSLMSYAYDFEVAAYYQIQQ